MHRTLALLLLASVSAQNPPLTPTSNLVLDTTATQGHFAFSHIDIPSGVRVSFTGTFPVIGNTWELRVAAPRGNGVTLAASFQPGSTTNQFGIIGIDLPNAIVFTFLQLPNTGHDPLATYQLAISNDPGLIGIHLYVAGLDWLTTLPPRYTNTISTTVQ